MSAIAHKIIFYLCKSINNVHILISFELFIVGRIDGHCSFVVEWYRVRYMVREFYDWCSHRKILWSVFICLNVHLRKFQAC